MVDLGSSQFWGSRFLPGRVLGFLKKLFLSSVVQLLDLEILSKNQAQKCIFRQFHRGTLCQSQNLAKNLFFCRFFCRYLRFKNCTMILNIRVETRRGQGGVAPLDPETFWRFLSAFGDIFDLELGSHIFG